MDGGTLYELKSQARCLAAVEGDADRNRFLLGTLNLRAANELHVVEYNEDTSEATCVQVYEMPHETWDLCSCPGAEHAGKVLAVHNDAGATQFAVMYDVDAIRTDGLEPAGSHAGGPPGKLATLSAGKSPAEAVRKVAWDPTGDATRVVTLSRSRIDLWALDKPSGTPAPAATCQAPAPPDNVPKSRVASRAWNALCWDPHHANTLATGDGAGNVATIDLRTMAVAGSVAGAHAEPIRHLDYNPNRPHVILSCGEDDEVKFWDLRKLGGGAADAGGLKPLRTLREGGHAHWVTCARYNRFHDQLVLTGSTDGGVKLWRCAEISSSPPADDGYEGEDGEGSNEKDGVAKNYTMHEESVYSVVWSAADAWIFGSLSFDGRLAMNYVPPAEKYRILL